jgi:major membrane immunogen (membrane-anchored lipoprotein)
MEIKQYIFDSPSSSPVQIGKLDTSTKKQESSQVENVASTATSSDTLKSVLSSAITSEEKATTPTTSLHLLDVYE